MRLIPITCAVSLAAAVVAACSNANDHALPGATASGTHVVGGGREATAAGSVGMHLLIAAGVHVNQLSWAISNGTNGYSGTVFITDDAGHEAQSVEFVAGGIAAGNGYVVSLSGTDTEGDNCQGASAPVAVGPGQTSGATVLVACTVATDATLPTAINSGNLAVDGGVELVMQAPFVCPAITGVSISPAEVHGCEKANLNATVTGGSGGTPTLAWSTSCPGATITPADAGTAAFQCGGQGGACAVTVTVGLNGAAPDGGSVGQVCTGVASTMVTESVVCEIGQGVCAPGLTSCPGAAGSCAGLNCVNLQNDNNNCGSCGHVCGLPSSTCQCGVCVSELPPPACTSAPCPLAAIKCDGTTSGICTPEEQIIVNKDILAGRYSCNQLNKSGPNRSCYECLVAAGCIDTNTIHGVECGDLTGTLMSGASSGETLANACLDVINCIEGSSFTSGQQFVGLSPTPAGTCADDANTGVANCFCGPGVGATSFPGPNDDIATCNSAAATADNGACLAVEYAGFGATNATANSIILGEFTTTTFAAGMANQLFACAGSDGLPACPQCF